MQWITRRFSITDIILVKALMALVVDLYFDEIFFTNHLCVPLISSVTFWASSRVDSTALACGVRVANLVTV